jgi:hypothetical protein
LDQLPNHRKHPLKKTYTEINQQLAMRITKALF